MSFAVGNRMFHPFGKRDGNDMFVHIAGDTRYVLTRHPDGWTLTDNGMENWQESFTNGEEAGPHIDEREKAKMRERVIAHPAAAPIVRVFETKRGGLTTPERRGDTWGGRVTQVTPKKECRGGVFRVFRDPREANSCAVLCTF